MSLIDQIRDEMPDNHDPVEWIMATRERINRTNLEFYKALLAELKEKIGVEGLQKSQEILGKKDSKRQWSNFTEILNRSMALGPRLLIGHSLEEAVSQYLRYHEHAESCWRQACDCFRVGRFNFSVFFSILTLEETGKLSLLWYELLSFQPGKLKKDSKARRKDPLYHHVKKHVLAACQGALVNSRLDRIIGVERIKSFLDDAASGTLETYRQRCLYSDFTPDGPSIPSEKISRDDALLFTIISGEIMADVLGNFPWEWDRMIKSVKEFETEVGISDEG